MPISGYSVKNLQIGRVKTTSPLVFKNQNPPLKEIFMKLSKFLVPTLKENPADAEVISHKLMVRAGMIRKLTAGIYSYLPLGYRSLRKVEQIVREEMNAAGAQEVYLPVVQPAELWKESGRWEIYGKELLRFRDRHDRECCLGPTHEEVITDLVRREARSYRDLPINLYQIQTKFRDEIRPRFGLMRGREFIMKDGYSFDTTEDGAERTYLEMRDAYQKIFTRCGLEFRSVEADSGPIGGNFSHEFMVLATTGEDTIVSCDSCDYAANMEKAETGTRSVSFPPPAKAPEPVITPGASTVEQIAKFLGLKAENIIKTLILKTENGPVAVLLRGDHELNEVKVKNFLKVADIDMADAATIEQVTGGPMGFSGPIGLENIRILADRTIFNIESAVVGGNKPETHLINVDPRHHFKVDDSGDFRAATEGDLCPRCSGTLRLNRGIEVGHIFKLGDKYSKAMNACFLDQEGKERFMIMGCYGIGVSRVLAAAIEQNHDDDGIIFPPPIAPFTAIITPVGAKSEPINKVAGDIYEALWKSGLEALMDDRDERPGVKFKDADLLGIPCRITIGQKALSQGNVELRNRRTKETILAPPERVVSEVQKLIESWGQLPHAE